MDDKLLKKYLAYARTEEARAVLFVKFNIEQSKGYWIDIVKCERLDKSKNRMHFRYVSGHLYK